MVAYAGGESAHDENASISPSPSLSSPLQFRLNQSKPPPRNPCTDGNHCKVGVNAGRARNCGRRAPPPASDSSLLGRRRQRRRLHRDDCREDTKDKETYDNELYASEVELAPYSVYRRILESARIANVEALVGHIRRAASRSSSSNDDDDDDDDDDDAGQSPSCGLASKAIYSAIISDRTYDAYGRPVPSVLNNDDVARRRAAAERVPRPAYEDSLHVRAQIMENALTMLRKKRLEIQKNKSENEMTTAVVTTAGGGGRRSEESRRWQRMRWSTTERSKEEPNNLYMSSIGDGGAEKKKKLDEKVASVAEDEDDDNDNDINYGEVRSTRVEEERSSYGYSKDVSQDSGEGGGIELYVTKDANTSANTDADPFRPRRSVPHGRGRSQRDMRRFYPGGIFYVGEWEWKELGRHGYPHGTGRASYGRGGVIYNGEWKRGKRHGFGTQMYSDGSTYKGEFRRGKFHGHGTHVSMTTEMTRSVTTGATMIGRMRKFTGEFRRGYACDGSGTFGSSGLIRHPATTDTPPSQEDIDDEEDATAMVKNSTEKEISQRRRTSGQERSARCRAISMIERKTKSSGGEKNDGSMPIMKRKGSREVREEAGAREDALHDGAARVAELDGYLQKVQARISARRKKERENSVKERRMMIRNGRTD